MNVSPLRFEDFEAWLPLWRAYLGFYQSTQDGATTKRVFERLTGPETVMGGFLARSFSGAALGLVHWVRHPSTWTLGDYCYLQDLYVDEAQRRAGAGRLLIEAVTAHARQSDCSRVYWLTRETNHTAIKLYDALAIRSGFIQYVKKLEPNSIPSR